MSDKRVVMVVDMQNGVFETPRHQREKCVSLINQLTQGRVLGRGVNSTGW